MDSDLSASLNDDFLAWYSEVDIWDHIYFDAECWAFNMFCDMNLHTLGGVPWILV